MHHATARRYSLVAASLTLLVATAPFARAQQATAPARGLSRQMQTADLKSWRSIRQSALSNDGKWFAYVLAPNEGDASVIIKSTGTDGKEMKFPIGDASAGGGRGGGAGGPGGPASPSLSISGDSKWVAFTVYPPAAVAGRGARGGRGGGGGGGGAQGANGAAATPPAQNKMALVNIATGEKKEFDKVRSFSFNGDKPNYIAMQGFPEQAPAANGAAPAGGAGGGRGAAGRPDGTDLVLYSLATGDAINVGNVAEFDFDESGEWL